MSGESPSPTPEQAMDMHVSNAVARLNDGALVRETLEYLWRVGFAAGVRAGQQPGNRDLGPVSDRVRRIEQADRDGWRYGTPWVYMGDMARPGFRFLYGGVDRDGPNCEREAMTLPAGPKGTRMQLSDTGETVRIPTICWSRPLEEAKSG